MSYGDLLRECERDGIGALFWEVLVSVCRRVARRYPPEAYNNGERWSEESFEDLAQDVAVERLLSDENQLDYVLRLATDEDSLRALLGFQVARVLAHRRTVTVVDRLVRRIGKIVDDEPYTSTPLGKDRYVSVDDGTDRTPEPAFLAPDEVRRGAEAILDIPRLPSNVSGKRESPVYRPEYLRELVARLVHAFDGIALSDVRKILELVLTAWLPTFLRDTEDDSASDASPESELIRTHMNDLIEELVHQVTPAHRTVLLGKSQGVADGALAARLGRSRPWLADRKAEALALLETQLIVHLPSELHDEATHLLLEQLAALEEDADG